MPAATKHPALPAKGETKVYHTADGAPYVICNSTSTFVNPTADSPSKSCEEINATLNLNLGQSWVTRNNPLGRLILWVSRCLDLVLFEWWEWIPMYIYNECVPLAWKRIVTKYGWNFFLALHSRLLGKSTGLHPSQSLEYHAMTTMMFASNFLAWTPQRMRFFLKEVNATAPNDPPSSDRVDVIEEDMTTPELKIPPEQADHSTVRGWYIRRTAQRDDQQKRNVIFWIYGGAYLSGDVRGNASVADYLAANTHCDVFIPSFRLAPEANLFDVLWDVCLALYWLQLDGKEQVAAAESPTIFVAGVSSGAAIACRVLQAMAQQERQQDMNLPAYFIPLVQRLTLGNIGGAVLFNPYVDYTQLHPEERKGSFQHYAKHDLVVNEAVQEYGLPYLEDFIPTLEKDDNDTDDPATKNRKARHRQSPIHQNCTGVPPLCVIASQHEAVYDMTCDLVNRARSEGVEVTMGMWKYMCHVFGILHGFLPEGQLCMDFVVAWIQEQQQKEQLAKKG